MDMEKKVVRKAQRNPDFEIDDFSPAEQAILKDAARRVRVAPSKVKLTEKADGERSVELTGMNGLDVAMQQMNQQHELRDEESRTDADEVEQSESPES